MKKWLESIKTPEDNGSDVSEDQKKKNDKWLSFFVKGSSQSSKDCSSMLKELPEDIKEIFFYDKFKFNKKEGEKNGRNEIRIEDIDNIRASVIKTLNLMERIAVAFNNEIINRKIIETSFQDAIVTYTKGLKKFMFKYDTIYKKDKDRSYWQPLKNLVLEDGGNWKTPDIEAPYKKSKNK
jgi:hypothetical protein